MSNPLMKSPPRTVWRIVSGRYAATPFDGEGARLYGGRWNFAGLPLVYSASTLALAALELFIHLEPSLAPADLVAVSADIPADLKTERITVSELPPDWRHYPAPDRLKRFGAEWLRGRTSAVLLVPSVVIPEEINVLLNPLHPDFPQIRPGLGKPFSFDPRMWK